jgi:UDPglucose 6-dehydrogenase/GDP-mannose 6-dehydrogenase
MKLSIVGTGYVGLVSGACLADRGHDVTCVDVDASKVESINAGRAPIHEPGLPELLAANIGKRLRATQDLGAAVRGSDMTMIAVGTPAVDGRISLEFVERAAGEIGRALAEKPGWHVVVVKSTVTPGTTDGAVRRAVEAASGKAAGAGFGLGMNPEFLTEGTAVADFMRPDRLVLGGIDARTQDALAGLYAAFPADVPRIRCNNATAEMIKYASNSLLATLISFSNEIGRLCSTVGNVDVSDVMRGVHASAYLTTRREGAEPVRAPIASFLEAGCGFGGSCLPKDVTALTAQGRDLGVEMPLLRSVLDINRSQPGELFRLAARHHPDLRGKRVAVLGLAFKPDTDDLRESPAFPVLNLFRDAGARLVAYDPVARPVGMPAMQGVELVESLTDAVAGADIVVLVTRWKEFEALPDVVREHAPGALVIDGRRVLPPAAFKAYEGIGR